MDQTRLDTLESQLAEQEHIISQLNAVVTRQQDQLDKLEASMNLMARRYQAMAEQMPESGGDEVPPHY